MCWKYIDGVDPSSRCRSIISEPEGSALAMLSIHSVEFRIASSVLILVGLWLALVTVGSSDSVNGSLSVRTHFAGVLEQWNPDRMISWLGTGTFEMVSSWSQ